MKGSHSTDAGLLVLRVGLGSLMLYYGSQKLFGAFGGGGLAATVEGMGSGRGIPPLFAYLAVAGEFFGGMGVLLGLLTRVAAFGVACTMGVATVLNLRNPEVLAAIPAGDGALVARFGYPFALCCIALALLLLGPGRWALDTRLLGKRARGKA